MKKIILLMSSFVIIGCGFLRINHYDSGKDSDLIKSYKIAIFTPVTHAALEEIEQGFKDTMLNKAPNCCEFITFNANGNRTLQRSQAEEIINGKFDLIFSVATSCTQLIAEIAKKKGTLAPQIFCSIEDPVGMGIIKSMASSGNNITGVVENSTNYSKIISIMQRLTPAIKNVLLVYDPGVNFSMEKEKIELELALQKAGIKLNCVEISQVNEIQQKVTVHLADNDIVLVLKDNTVVSGIDSLITLCNRYGIPLFVSDLNSGQMGAAIAYGIKEYDSGVGAAEKALQVFAGKKPYDIPITAIDKLTLMINRDVLQSQKISVDPELLKAIEQTDSFKELS